jgi:hypothetical protein
LPGARQNLPKLATPMAREHVLDALFRSDFDDFAVITFQRSKTRASLRQSCVSLNVWANARQCSPSVNYTGPKLPHNLRKAAPNARL